MRFATYTSGGATHFGAVTDAGMIALGQDFPNWPTLLDVVEADGLAALSEAAQGRAVTHADFQYEMVLPNARRILCVGVNFPDRNAEYKDGSDQPKYMSLFPRFASGFTGHDRPLIRPPESDKLDYEGEVAIVIGKAGRLGPPCQIQRHPGQELGSLGCPWALARSFHRGQPFG